MLRNLAALLLAGLPVASLAQSAVAIESDQQAQLAANMARGDLLYAYDQSAWHVTDAAMAALPDDAKKLLRGYVTTPAPNGFRTTFYGQDGSQRFKLYSAVWTGSALSDQQIFKAADKLLISDEEQRLIGARDAAVAKSDGLMICSTANPNVAMIPGATPGDPISVYIMTPQTKDGVYPLGGHNRIDVKDDKVVATRSFTRSCIDFDRASAASGGVNPVGMGITHLLDPVPTEIHAFSVHAAKLPLYVGVSSGAIFVVELKDGKAAARRIDGK